MTHGANQLAIAERMIAGEFDVADFDLGAFFNFENEDDRVTGSDSFVLGSDLGELTAVFTEQLAQHHFGFFDFRGIKLAFHAEADFAFLEAVENVGLGDGMNAVIANAADDRALFYVEDNNFCVGAVGGIFDAQLYVFKKLSVPKRLEVAAQSFFVVVIAFAAEDASF